MTITPVVVFPDATDIVATILRDGLDETFGETCPVVSRVPNPRPDRFVRLRRSGGPRQDLVVDAPSLTIESWDVDESAAQDLAQQCRAVIHAARGTVVDGVAIYRVAEFAGPAFLPDPLSDQHRYTQTISVALRGAEPVAS